MKKVSYYTAIAASARACASYHAAMTSIFWPMFVRLGVSVLVLLANAGPAHATLGQAPTLSAALSTPATLSISSRPGGYSLHQLTLDNGTSVRELVGANGVVFALSWRGPVLPDLKLLLGTYFNTLQRETEQAHLSGSRGAPVNLARDGLVLQSNGRMRHFFGQAYVPELVPNGVLISNELE